MSKIYGNLVCFNESPADVCRAIESLYPVCDEILVANGMGDKKLTEFLHERAHIYNLKVFDRPFDSVLNQRNFLLSKTPKNNWVVTLDSDERFSHVTMYALGSFLYNVDPALIDDPKRVDPLVIAIQHYNLVQDMYHWDGGPAIYHFQKAFYYDRDMEWYQEYYTHIRYPSQKEMGSNKTIYPTHPLALLHFARLNPKRLEWRKQHVNDLQYGAYKPGAWEKETPIVDLPEEVCY